MPESIGKKIRTVIVDDEAAERRLVRRQLERSCHDVEIVGEADSAENAEAVIQAGHPDLVILDIEMPVRTGFQLLDGHPDRGFDVIFIASHAHRALKAVKYLPVDFLLKPIDAGDLQRAVAKTATTRSSSGLRDAGLTRRGVPKHSPT